MMFNNDIDLLIEASAVEGQLLSGASPKLVAARSSLGVRGIAILAPKENRLHKRAKSPAWTEEEDKFLETYLSVLTEKEIADALGRSEMAVHLRWKRDLGLTALSKRSDTITAEQIANGLGVDSKTVHKLIDRDIMPGRRLPLKCCIRVVKKIDLLRFITNPMNWVYFKPSRVGKKPPRRAAKSYDAKFWAYAHRLVKEQQARWNDEWWSIGKMARYHGVDHGVINRAIHLGLVKATDWGNWWILKSHATDPSLRFYVGKGCKGEDRIGVSRKAKAFIVLAAAVGLTYADIGGMMKWNPKRIQYLLYLFRKNKLIKKIIEENNLPVFYKKTTSEIFADWRMHKKRFSRLAKRMESLDVCPPKTRSEMRCIWNVEHKARIFRQCYKVRKEH